jgi:hypothetical protein
MPAHQLTIGPQPNRFIPEAEQRQGDELADGRRFPALEGLGDFRGVMGDPRRDERR